MFKSNFIILKLAFDFLKVGHMDKLLCIIQVKDKFRFGNLLVKGKESFGVRVYPGVDYAFIMSLLTILNEIDFC